MSLRSLVLFGSALVLSGGIAFAGWQLSQGLERVRTADRYVSVKGLAERDVIADLAVWPLRFSATGDDLTQVQAKIDADVATVTEFLIQQGLDPEAITPRRPEVTDLLAQAYRPEGAGNNRFIVAQTLVVRSNDVEMVERIARQSGELARRGVVLSEQDGPFGGPTFIFTRLNDVKPEMIAEATRNARAGAEQFAADSGASVGGIRKASQGSFSILPRDPIGSMPESTQMQKQVRVVSTIEYFLE
ncbi:SIMPL domain-containing protein [Telmatospirillum sp. J64-1]|uniref:SIMPL domain-containing protein n=1 Tax=Telmatospirillum sp. J64-1 TaxID=2502183 RepID=UPI00115D8DBE|nr:SIMPL domain-containing protein [Telmatospirillum sp. J64-1]